MVATVHPRYKRTGIAFSETPDRPLVRLSHKLNAVVALVALVLIASIVGLGLYAYGHQGRVYQGVSVAGVDLSGMTRAEAEQELQRGYSLYMNTPLVLTHDGKNYAITPGELGVTIDTSLSVDAAFEYGRDGSLWGRSRDWVEALFSGADVPASVTVDPVRTDAGLLALTEVVAYPPTNASIDLSGDEPSIVPEVSGQGYDYGATRALVLDRIAHQSAEPVEVITTVINADVTELTLAATLPSARTALGAAFTVTGLNGQRWILDQQQLKAIVSVSPDGSGVTVNRVALEQMVVTVNDEIRQDSSNAVLFINGDGQLEVVSARQSIAVDIEKSVADLESAILDGDGEMALTIERDDPPITDDVAQAAMTSIQETLADGITVKWDGGQKTLTSDDLLAALVIQTDPKADEPFSFTLSPQVLTGYIQAFAGDIEVEPSEPTFRLVDGEITAVEKGRTGVLINYENSVQRITQALFKGYPSSNLKVETFEAEYTVKDLKNIKLPDVLGEAATPYSNSSEARKTNVERAVDLQNGWLIPPGGEYSYVALMGEITEDNGFEVGLGIVADPNNPGAVMTAPVIGGGICQVSTTIFQSAFWAGLTFTERHQHPYWINSYGVGKGGLKGLDAMVNIEIEPTEWAVTLDMRFINTTGNWIAIEMAADGENVTSRILGTNPGWDIQAEDPKISNTVKPNSTPIRQDSPEIPLGEERQVETAQDGFDAEIVRTVRDRDGNIIDTYVVSSSYSATSNRVLVGTGQ